MKMAIHTMDLIVLAIVMTIYGLLHADMISVWFAIPGVVLAAYMLGRVLNVYEQPAIFKIFKNE